MHHAEMEDLNVPAPEASVTGSATASSTPGSASLSPEQIVEQKRQRNELEAATAMTVESPVLATPAGSPSGLAEAMGTISL
eukprot:2709904-Pyramimonas_sp.AAC.1